MIENKNNFTDNHRIVYFGKAFDELTHYIIELVNNNNPLSSAKKVLKKRIPFLITESFQNVIRHTIQDEDFSSDAIKNDFFQVLFNDEVVYIESSNIVSEKDKEKLTKAIESLNNTSKENLKELSREVLNNGNLSNRGGAGLGLIEIARKIGSPIIFDFKKYKDAYYHFFMSLKLQSNDDAKIENSDRLISDFELYKEQKVLSLFEGDFSNEINKDIVNVFNQNIQSNPKINKDLYRSMMTLIEVLQNVTKHGLAINNVIKGSLKIYLFDGKLRLFCQNYIATSDVSKLDKHLSLIKKSSIDKLKSQYAEILDKDNINNDNSIGLGLLEIALNSKKDFEYAFLNTEKNTLFSIDIKL